MKKMNLRKMIFSSKSVKIMTLALAGIFIVPSFVSCDKSDKGFAKESKSKSGVNPDLVYNDLQGPVKMATLKRDWGDGAFQYAEYFYDSDGSWLNIPRWAGYDKKSFPNYDGEKYEKDMDGYIVKTYELPEGEGEMYPEITTIVWEDGKMKKKTVESRSTEPDYYYSSQNVTNYYYNDKGLVERAETQYSSSDSWGGSNSKSIDEYSYVEFDDKGNWTKRHVNSTSTYGDGQPYTSTSTELRDIIYYED